MSLSNEDRRSRFNKILTHSFKMLVLLDFFVKLILIAGLKLVFERTHISSNLSFIELENFKFEHISSSKKMNFWSLSSSLKTSLLRFESILEYFKFYDVIVSQNYQPLNSNFIKFEI